MTGQPDFAHLVIDYVPRAKLVESKSLKLFLGSFRNHARLPRGLHAGDRPSGWRRCWRRAGCASAATGIRAAACRSTCSGRPARRPRACGCPTPAWRPIAAGDNGRHAAPTRSDRRSRQRRASCATRSAPRRCGSASTPWASRPRQLAPEARRRAAGAAGSVRRAGLPGRHGLAGRARRAARRSRDPVARGAHRRVARAQLRADEPIRATCSRQRERGAISVYAQGRDYHDVMKTQAEGARPLHLGHLPPQP